MSRREAMPAGPAGGDPSAGPGQGGAYKWWVLATISVWTLMGTMDSSIVTISLPTLTKVFHTDTSTVLWVTLAAQLTVIGILVTVGRVGDMLGRKRVYTLGLGIYTCGLALCSLAQGIVPLILFRVLQGLGSAMSLALGNAILVGAFPSRERGKALGILEAVVGTGLMTGPALGGFILEFLGWRAIFYLRIPLGLLGCALALVVLKEQAPGEPQGRLDLRGAAALFVGLSTLILGINQGPARGWGSPLVLGLEATAAVCLAAFLLIEKRAPHPVVDLGLFRSRPFAVANAGMVLYATGTVSVSFLVPFYLIHALGVSPAKAGLTLITVPLVMLVLSPGTGWLSDRIGARPLMTAGLACQCLGLFLLSQLTLESSVTQVVLFLGVGGLGSGLFWTPTYAFIMGAAPLHQLGAVSALIPTLRNIGHATGLAVAGAVFAAQQAAHLPEAASGLPSAAVVAGFQGALLAMAGLALLALALSVLGGSGARAEGAAGGAEPRKP